MDASDFGQEMIIATPYNPQTGRISKPWYSSNPNTFELNASPEQQFIAGEFDGDIHYVDLAVSPMLIKDRPTFQPLADKSSIAANGVEVLTVTKLPKGTTQIELIGPVSDTWNETRQKTDFTINVPGHYKLKISQWPYQDREVEFDAT